MNQYKRCRLSERTHARVFFDSFFAVHFLAKRYSLQVSERKTLVKI